MKTQTTAQPETIFDRQLRPLVEREVMSNAAPAIPPVSGAKPVLGAAGIMICPRCGKERPAVHTCKGVKP